MTENGVGINTTKSMEEHARQDDKRVDELRRAYCDNAGNVARMLRSLGVRDDQLEDFVQDVFATAYRCWDTYDHSRPLRPWLLGIAYRVVLHSRRRFACRLRALRRVPPPLDGGSDSSPEENLATTQARRILERILDQMDLSRRVVFVMHDIEGTPMPQIAEALDLPLNTAYSRLRLARQQFNSAIASIRAREASLARVINPLTKRGEQRS